VAVLLAASFPFFLSFSFSLCGRSGVSENCGHIRTDNDLVEMSLSAVVEVEVELTSGEADDEYLWGRRPPKVSEV
jgi:hypothetical protein